MDKRRAALNIGGLAQEALCLEALTTPKPGLVDRNNSGAHRDMDCGLLLRSARVQYPYYCSIALGGMETVGLPPREAFAGLRPLGRRAEAAMLLATGGVNTHRGAVFSLGVLCAAAGRLLARGEGLFPAPICREAAALAEGVSRELERGADTHGLRAFRRYGAPGVRGETEAGFPSLLRFGLPALEAGLAAGDSLEHALCSALVALMANVRDTNVLARGGLAGARFVERSAGALYARLPLPREQFVPALLALDRAFIRRNLSPGGCADLVAAACFLHRLAQGRTA